jgi:hypothetical protein
MGEIMIVTIFAISIITCVIVIGIALEIKRKK